MVVLGFPVRLWALPTSTVTGRFYDAGMADSPPPRPLPRLLRPVRRTACYGLAAVLLLPAAITLTQAAIPPDPLEVHADPLEAPLGMRLVPAREPHHPHSVRFALVAPPGEGANPAGPAARADSEDTQAGAPSSAAGQDVPWAWQPWKPTGFRASYFTVLPRTADNAIELWFDARSGDRDVIVGLVGANLADLPRSAPRFDSSLVSGYSRHREGPNPIEFPILSRSGVTRLADGSYLVLTQVGPRYTGGDTELYPMIFASPDGRPGNWRQVGPLKGEPLAWLEQTARNNQRIRCEGGSIIQLPGDRFRLYIQGFGVRLAMAEADKPEGPWTFDRDDEGRIRDQVAHLPEGGQWLFPQVMTIGEHGYLLTGADRWPPTRITAALSTDGRRFRLPPVQDVPRPLIRPADIIPESTMIKALRGAYHPETQRFEAVASVWHPEQRTFLLMTSSTRLNPAVFQRLSDDGEREEKNGSD